MIGLTLQLCSVTRRFEQVVAVQDLSLELQPGQVHAIVGENGAGKSTALKLLSGHLRPNSGQVLVEQRPLRPATAHEGIRRGIGMVHQHFMLVDNFTALENLILGCEPTSRTGRIDFQRARKQALAVAQEVGLELELEQKVSSFNVGQRQKLEILRVLFRGARAVLLDEPTAVLSPTGVAQLYGTLRQLAQTGSTIAVVTHRLDEVVRYCDVVSVMRRGRLVLHQETRAENQDASGLSRRLTRAIMGSEPPAEVDPPPLDEPSDAVLHIHELSVAASGSSAADDRPKAVDRLQLSLRGGEIVGVAGVEGNGQRELARALAGLDPLMSGRVELAGQELFSQPDKKTRQLEPGPKAVRQAQKLGLVVVHEDRQRDELVLPATVADNLVLGDLGQIDEPAAKRRRFEKFDVQPPDPSRLAAELSGGNQQKVVVARALDRPLKVLVLSQPTRGVDVAAARSIHQAIADTAAAGTAVLLISADLSELKRLSHRLIVMRRGRIAADLPPTASDETIGRAMLGTAGA